MQRTSRKVSMWILVVCLLLMQVVPVYAYSEPTLCATNATAYAGETVDVSIVMYNNPGIVSMQLDIGYDSSVLTLTKITDGGLIGSAVHSNNLTLCPYRLTWANDLATTNYTNNGTIVTLTFAIADGATVGEYPITVNYTKNNFEIFDCDANEVDFDAVSGSVTIAAKQCSHTSKTEVPAKSADCVNSGNNLYYTCDSCGQAFKADGATETTVEAEIISALGHDYADAACTAPKTCEVCGATDGAALGHSFTNYTSNNDATCTADGTKTAECDRCDATDTVADAGSAKGHDYADAACTTPKTCKICGATDGAALGHSFTNYVSNDDATCTEDGTKTAKCDRCHVTDTITDAGSAKGHDYADATCTEPKTCKVCGAAEGNPLGHNYASVWSKGEDGHWHECSACGDKADYASHDYGSEGDKCVACEYQRAHVHRLTVVSAADATCTEDGNKAYYTCSGCEDWFEDASGSVVISDKTSVVVGALGHDLTEATCTDAAECQRENCDHVEGTALGHSFTNYTSNNDATCTADGTKTAQCDRCDATDTVADTGSAKGHDCADATCTSPKTCKVCGASEGEALGHSYASTWSKGEDGHWHECSACGDEADYASHDYGSEGSTCVACEYEYTHIHELTLVPGVDAACTEDGSQAYYTCSGCENWFEDASGTIVIADKTSVHIGALGHDMTEASCSEAPCCQRDGCAYTEGAALGHADADADNKCDVCGAAMESDQPTTPEKPTDDNPQTGDNSGIMLWTILLILSFAGVIVCVLSDKKRNMA